MDRKTRNRRGGFSLIETVLAVIILGICLTPVSILIINVMSQNVHSQAEATAAALAEATLENVTNTRFSSIVNTTAVTFSAPFGAYTYRMSAGNVTAGDLNTTVAADTGYKLVKVIVNNSITGEVVLTTLVTRDW